MLERWALLRGNAILGRLTVRDIDQPSFVCDFEPTKAYEEVRPLFEEELRLLNADKMDEWDRAYDAIEALGLRLQSLDGDKTLKKFLLHIENGEAWFSY